MIKEINLLKESNTEPKNITRLRVYIKILTPIALVIFIVFVVVVYGFALVQKSKAEEMAFKIKNTKTSIEEKSDIESYYRGSKIKLQSVSKILNEQIDYAKIIGYLNKIQPENIELTALTMANNGNINVSYRAENSDILATLINLLLDENTGSKYFEQIKIKTLFYGKDGYQVNLNFFIKK